MSRIAGRGRYATETYPEAPRGGGSSGAALEPILLELWVGVLTTPPTTPNGSIEAPFLTLQDAFDFVTALPVANNTKVTYYVNSRVAPEAPTTPNRGAHNIIGQDISTGSPPTPFAITITPADGQTLTVGLHNMSGTAFITGDTGHVNLNVSNDAAGVTTPAIPDLAISSNFPDGTIDLVVVNGSMTSVQAATARGRFYNCQFPPSGTIQLFAIDTAANCDFHPSNQYQVFDVPNGLGFVSCNFHGAAGAFDGPANSFLVDVTSALSWAGTFTSGATGTYGAFEGQVLTVVSALPAWAPGAATNLIPIHYQFWVGTLDAPPAVPNGSIEAPFVDLDSALVVGNALPDDVIVDYFVADDTYAITEHIGTNKHTRIVSMCGGTTLTGSVIVDCAIGNTTLELIDISTPDGIAPTSVGGGGNCNLRLNSPTDTAVVSNISDAALLAGNLTIRASGGRIENISTPDRCTEIGTDGTDLGSTDGGLCQFSFIDGNIEGDTSVGVITSAPGILDAVIGNPSPEVNITFTVAAANQAVCIRSTVFRTGGTFNGPAASFSSDIDSAESFSHLWGLGGGATTNFTVEGAEGKVLTVLGGFPQWV